MRLLIVALAAVCLVPSAGTGQGIELEARGGLSIGSHSSTFAGLDLLPYPMGEVLVKRPWRENLAFTIGGFYSSFGCEEGFCAGSREVRVQHFSAGAGLEAKYSIAWLRGMAGFGMTQIQRETEQGPAAHLAGGVRLDFGPVTVSPGLTLRWMKSGNETFVVGTDIGLIYRIGGDQ